MPSTRMKSRAPSRVSTTPAERTSSPPRKSSAACARTSGRRGPFRTTLTSGSRTGPSASMATRSSVCPATFTPSATSVRWASGDARAPRTRPCATACRKAWSRTRAPRTRSSSSASMLASGSATRPCDSRVPDPRTLASCRKGTRARSGTVARASKRIALAAPSRRTSASAFIVPPAAPIHAETWAAESSPCTSTCAEAGAPIASDGASPRSASSVARRSSCASTWSPCRAPAKVSGTSPIPSLRVHGRLSASARRERQVPADGGRDRLWCEADDCQVESPHGRRRPAVVVPEGRVHRRRARAKLPDGAEPAANAHALPTKRADLNPRRRRRLRRMPGCERLSKRRLAVSGSHQRRVDAAKVHVVDDHRDISAAAYLGPGERGQANAHGHAVGRR